MDKTIEVVGNRHRKLPAAGELRTGAPRLRSGSRTRGGPCARMCKRDYDPNRLLAEFYKPAFTYTRRALDKRHWQTRAP